MGRETGGGMFVAKLHLFVVAGTEPGPDPPRVSTSNLT